MINLHAIVRTVIPVLHPDEAVTLRQSTGQVNNRGKITPVYSAAQSIKAQIQTLGQNDLAQSEATSTTRIDRKAYLYADAAVTPPNGQIRVFARTGDYIKRADGTWWLITSMIEDFTASGWVCVGLTQQVQGPDLSLSPADPVEPTDPAYTFTTTISGAILEPDTDTIKSLINGTATLDGGTMDTDTGTITGAITGTITDAATGKITGQLTGTITGTYAKDQTTDTDTDTGSDTDTDSGD